MTAVSVESAGHPRPPGLYIETGVRADAARDPELMTGVPAFLGFGSVKDAPLRAAAPGIVLDRWDARFWQDSVVPAEGSFLRAAVRGFFANGGRRCVVFPLAPSSERLIRALEPGGLLDDRSDIDLVCLPDAVGPLADETLQLDVYEAALRHCETMGDRFALLDAPAIGDAPAARTGPGDDRLLPWVQLLANLHSAHGALYGPWIAPDRLADGPAVPLLAAAQEWRCLARAADGQAAGPLRFVPPSGHVAGVIARLDERVGAQHAPANEALAGVLDTALHLDGAVRGRLNADGFNVIQGAKGRGIRVGGARTLSGHGPLAYVSSARVVLGLRRWLAVRMRDLVFEAQTPRLWDVIRDRLQARCLALQRAGALAGDSAEDAFFVKCDAETNPPTERDAGRVVAHIGLAPSVPAEFIVIRVVQDASGLTVSGLS